ncbi:MAG: hypothetical protein N2327_01920 [Caldimicrobium sp.]|nr:hypothetical protein [Caldimicrobium sp.]MCX7873176.1 hypothetical protein [Caldimicrobium sp.]MDW8094245.1 hypothetical protein [Caldimicrobium sp.]
MLKEVAQGLIEFILRNKREHPCKEWLKPLVERFCRKRGIKKRISFRRGSKEALVIMGRQEGLLRGKRGGRGSGNRGGRRGLQPGELV